MRWRYLLTAVLAALLGFAGTFLSDFLESAKPAKPGELTICRSFLLNHLPNTPFTSGKPYDPFKWASPVEELMMQFWVLNWLRERGAWAAQVSAWTALLFWGAAFGIDAIRKPQASIKEAESIGTLVSMTISSDEQSVPDLASDKDDSTESASNDAVDRVTLRLSDHQ